MKNIQKNKNKNQVTALRTSAFLITISVTLAGPLSLGYADNAALQAAAAQATATFEGARPGISTYEDPAPVPTASQPAPTPAAITPVGSTPGTVAAPGTPPVAAATIAATPTAPATPKEGKKSLGSRAIGFVSNLIKGIGNSTIGLIGESKPFFAAGAIIGGAFGLFAGMMDSGWTSGFLGSTLGILGKVATLGGLTSGLGFFGLAISGLIAGALVLGGLRIAWGLLSNGLDALSGLFSGGK